ncbi:MAG: phosphoribosylglycinamide formyltransferase [Saprospiraceae bacterium]|jgi:phosphoribosylglycinamide formyltransferase-1
MQATAKRIALFASGTGSNARNIMAYFSSREDVRVALLVCNKPDAPVLRIADDFSVPTLIIQRTDIQEGNTPLLRALTQTYAIDFIVLAGFLWKIPATLVAQFPGRIVNIHPSLLPLHGGKGMYGMRVHEAVCAAAERESGITIHYVNEHYDEGAVIFQAQCPVSPGDSPGDVARKVQALEHRFFPGVVDAVLHGQPISPERLSAHPDRPA